MMWYLQRNLKPYGPLSEQDVIKKIRSGDLRPFDLVLSENMENWIPALSAFSRNRSDFPSLQKLPPQGSFWRDYEMRDWILLVTDLDGKKVQKGPVSFDECIIASQQSSELVYCWKPGLSGWVPVVDRPEYQSEFIPDLS